MAPFNNNQQAFFALLRAGLWEKDVRLLQFGNIDFASVQQLAEDHSVVGLVAAGLEHVMDVKIQKKDSMPVIGQTLQLEQQNTEMNRFISVIVGKLRESGIHVLLVKGQGIAQCYERPLWRTCGDIDFLLDDDNYEKAKFFLKTLAQSEAEEDERRNHLSVTIGDWLVELHGTLHSLQLPKMNGVIDQAQESSLYGNQVRIWNNGGTEVFLPSPDNDIIFIFCHILQHFFGGGIGLRQVCDLGRLLWVYKDVINDSLLEKRLLDMGVMTEWNAFMALLVNYLGMPREACPLYSSSKRWNRKSLRLCSFFLETGDPSKSIESDNNSKSQYIIRKIVSLWVYTKYAIKQFFIFPKDALVGWYNLILNGFYWTARGK